MPKAVSLAPAEGKPGYLYFPLTIDDIPRPAPRNQHVILRMHAAALNHRDHFIRQNLYPNVAFGVPLLADGCGAVVGLGQGTDHSWLSKRVVVYPGKGWKTDPFGPEESFSILGGTSTFATGTLQTYMEVHQDTLELAPQHLSDVECAALPMTGGVRSWPNAASILVLGKGS
jgi:NADPH:quinone reductase-like Zn-dependent oxidoreductase